MLYHIFYPLASDIKLFNIFKYLTFRTIYAMITALVRAGYTYSYADGRAINTHPLIQRVAPNSYRLIDEHT